jgi:hypothetical protein
MNKGIIELINLIDELHEDIWETDDDCDLLGFSYTYNGEDYIKFDDFIVYSDAESDRGWDDENDDYERTIREQVIFEMKKLRNKLDIVIKAIDKES